MPAFAAVIATSLAIATPTAHAAKCPGADLSAAVASIDSVRSATLCLLNDERTAHGLTPLTSQPLLDSVATSYSRAMVDQRFFAHVSPAGQDLQQRLNSYIGPAQTWDVGENLAWGEGSYATPGGTVDGWMHSDGHRANILNANFREVGIGVVPGSPVGSAPGDSATYTADFGARVTSAPAPHPAAQRPSAAPMAGSASAHPASATTSAASKTTARTAAAKQPKIVSAAKKRAIKAQCARIAKRSRAARAARKARAASCARAKLRAAARG